MDALIGLLDHPDAVGGVFNVGSTEEVTILELAQRIVELAGTGAPIELVPYDQAYATGFEDMRRRVPDTTKIRDLLGWQPRHRLDLVLRETIVEAEAERDAVHPSGNVIDLTDEYVAAANGRR